MVTMELRRQKKERKKERERSEGKKSRTEREKHFLFFLLVGFRSAANVGTLSCRSIKCEDCHLYR
jgi:hypothetical protein